MKRNWPLGLILIGLLIILAGFVYDVLFAGIPYQDPTPAMQAAYDYHAQVAAVIRWAGAGITILGGLSILLRRAKIAQSKNA